MTGCFPPKGDAALLFAAFLLLEETRHWPPQALQHTGGTRAPQNDETKQKLDENLHARTLLMSLAICSCCTSGLACCSPLCHTCRDAVQHRKLTQCPTHHTPGGHHASMG